MPARVETTLVHRHDGRTGAWLTVDADQRRVRVRAGGTGNRLDPARRVQRSGWEIRCIGGRLELLATWPVPELVTHRIGEQIAQLRDDVASAGGDLGTDLAAVAAALAPVVATASGPHTPIEPRHRLDALLWSSAYPLLRVPIGRGAALDQVPVALDAVLRAPDPRRAARLAFGRLTRPLVRALAASLLPRDAAPTGRIPFEPALLALMASPWCGPEQLTEILGTVPHRAGAVAFDVGEVDRARAMFDGVRPRRITMQLCAALAEPDGTRRLARALAEWSPPPEGPRPIGRAGRAHPGQAPAQPPPTDVALGHPTAVQAVAGTEVAGRRIIVPRTADELLDWGRVLDNCLGGFRHAVADGRTHVLGLTEAGRLRYAVEVTRAGVVRQFEGRGNQQAPDHIVDPVLALLRARGVVRTDGRRGRSLVAPR